MSDLIKIEYTYSDGIKKKLEGEQLDNWMNFNRLVASHASNHSMNPPWDEIKWKEVENINKKIKDES